MRGFLNVLFLTLVVLVSFFVFFPKEKLYFLAQEKLLAYNVTLKSKVVKSNAFSLELRDLDVFLSGSRVANVGEVRIGLFGVLAKDARADGTFKEMLPVASVVDAGLGFGEIARASGNFGEVVASLNLSERKLVLEAFVDENTKRKYNAVFVRFKKVGDRYVYEISL